jgi:hypothetical protein
MDDFGGDLVQRILARPGEEADETGAARRKAQLADSISRLHADHAERVRIEGVAAQAGMTDPAVQVPPGNDAPRPAWVDELDLTGSADRAWQQVDQELRRTAEKPKANTRAGDYLVWLGGADKEILAQVPQERGVFSQMAGVLLTTAGIATLSMFFALHDGVGEPMAASAVLGLLWGVVILNLDRFLVLSMSGIRERGRLLLITLPRLALAVLLALVISTPLVLRIFASDINEQLFVMQQQRAKQQTVLIAQSAIGQQAAQSQEKINADESILSGHLPESIVNPQLSSEQTQVATLESQVHNDFNTEKSALETWQCELLGQNCSGKSSGITGDGPIAKADQLRYEQARSAYDSDLTQLNRAQQTENDLQVEFQAEESARLKQLQEAATQALPGLQARYSSAEQKIQSASQLGDSTNDADKGILAQLQALQEVSAHSSSLEAARLAVLALFFVIEILPVTVKFLLNLGPASGYDRAARLKLEERIEALQNTLQKAAQAHRMKTQYIADAFGNTLRRLND